MTSLLREHSAEIFINPLGRVSELELLSAGFMFDVYGGRLDGEPVCVKVPAKTMSLHERAIRERLSVTRSFVFYKPWTPHGANTPLKTQLIHTSHDPGDGDVPPGLSAAILTTQAHVLGRTGAAWNHCLIGLGIWGDADYGRAMPDDGIPYPKSIYPEAGPALPPALVMERAAARPLSSYPLADQNRLFKKALPALWRALAAHPHGDLKPEHILVSEDGATVHLIDPGVCLSWQQSYDRDTDAVVQLITTNPAHYPVLRPQFQAGPVPAWRRSLVEIADYLADDHHWLNAEWMSEPADGKPGAQPDCADMLALGIIHYRILTGQEVGEIFSQAVTLSTIDSGAPPSLLPFWINRPDMGGTFEVAMAGLAMAMQSPGFDIWLFDEDNILDETESVSGDMSLAVSLITLEIDSAAGLADLING